VLKTPGIADGAVTAAIRPEGFDLEENGAFVCRLHRVEVMGRDISVVCDHDDCQAPVIRAIISAENEVDTGKPTVAFNLKPEKVFLFDPQTGERLRFGMN
jgi:multiple sugar transport system ATP-binding protein